MALPVTALALVDLLAGARAFPIGTAMDIGAVDTVAIAMAVLGGALAGVLVLAMMQRWRR